ncbi:copper chaperone PCu(A)C [Sphingomonas sp. FW199]|uniref:copper chaperone PCu(A)C n=1 Tax=Sphingomonas sp. FW199 TaxID=3400217 RepID=UPI003CEE34FC
MVRRILAPLASALVLALAACGGPPAPEASDAWVRLPAVEGRPAAAYFRFTAGREAKTLVGISTPIAGRTELHESIKSESGAMSMAPVADVPVPSGDTLSFEPGGKHAMLFDIKPEAKPGASAPLTLKFEDGSTVEVEAKLVGAGDPAPAN